MSLAAGLGWLFTGCALAAVWLTVRWRRSRLLSPSADASARVGYTALVALAGAMISLVGVLTATGGSFTTFLATTGLFTGVAGALAVPLIVAAHRRGRGRIITRFAVAAAAIGFLNGMLAANSERLVDQCRQAIVRGECIDYGTTGFQIVLLVGFGFAALVQAYWLHTE